MAETDGTAATGNVLGDFQAIGDAARQTGQQAREAGANALDQARDVAQEAQARAASVADTIGKQAASIAEARKETLADTLEDVAKAVHRSGEQLEGHQDWVAHLVERGAAELNGLATTLRRNDLQGLLNDLGSLARRQPALFVGASMAAGFALTRIGRLAVEGASQAASAAASPSTPAQSIPDQSTPDQSGPTSSIPTPAALTPASSPEAFDERG